MPSFTDVSLQTARLTLRPLAEADTDAVFAMRSDPVVQRYGSHPPWTERQTAVDYIARERPTVAATCLEELLKRTGALSRFPRRGCAVPEIARPPYREIRHAPYWVIHRVDETQVVILTVRPSRRAWDSTEVPDGV